MGNQEIDKKEELQFTPITITANISKYELSKIQTKGSILNTDGSGEFENNDIITLIAKYNNSIKKLNYNKKGDTYWESFGFNNINTNASLQLCACYPQLGSENLTNLERVSLFSNESNKNKYHDLLIASAIPCKYKDKEAIQMTFKHAMHKLIIKLTPDDGYTILDMKNIVVTLKNVKTSFNINFDNGIVTAKGDEYNMEKTGTTEAVFIVPPQEISNLRLCFTKEGEHTKEISFPTNYDNNININKLEQGKILQLNYLIKKEKISLISIDIAGWELQGTINDTIII